MYIFCCFILRLAYSFSSFPNVVFFWPFHFETGISSLQFSYISNETENRTNNENRYLSPFYTIILILHHYWWHANFRNIPQKTNLSLRKPILGDRFLRERLFFCGNLRVKLLTFNLANQSSVKRLSMIIQEMEIFQCHGNVTIGGENLGLYICLALTAFQIARLQPVSLQNCSSSVLKSWSNVLQLLKDRSSLLASCDKQIIPFYLF